MPQTLCGTLTTGHADYDSWHLNWDNHMDASVCPVTIYEAPSVADDGLEAVDDVDDGEAAAAAERALRHERVISAHALVSVVACDDLSLRDHQRMKSALASVVLSRGGRACEWSSG